MVVSLPANAEFVGGKTVIITVSLDIGHMPLQTHQTNIFVGADKTVIAELFNNGFVITGLPPATVQTPTPTVGALPFKVAEVTQVVWSIPASAEVGKASIIICTVSFEGGQEPFVTVQIKAFVPVVNPVKVEIFNVGLLTELPPNKTDQHPDPITGFTAFKLKVVAPQKF
jgi:hypothetical protein